jgi:hypothetical protein
MKRGTALMKLATALCVFGTLSPAFASDNVPSAGVTGQLIELLKAKNLITVEEAQRLQGEGEGSDRTLAQLIGMLKEKSLISSDEASSLSGLMAQGSPAAVIKADKGPEPPAPLFKPLTREEVVERLRASWTESGQPLEEFDQLLSEMTDLKVVIDHMRSNGYINADEADILEYQYNNDPAGAAVVRVLADKEKALLTRVRSRVARDIDEGVKDQLKGQWWQKVKVGGDLRVRYQGDFFDDGNVLLDKPDKLESMNTTEDRHRLRIRARLGVTAKIDENFDAGISLATGNTTDPVSTNATLGDSLNKKTIALDKAYLHWKTDESMDFWFGRFANPWFSTDLVWDQDINFDGIAASYAPKLTDSLSLFFSAGAFPIQEVEASSHDKWLLGGQAGIKYVNYQNYIAKLGVALYDFENTQGEFNQAQAPNQYDYTAAQFMQKGNSVFNINSQVPGAAYKAAYASQFRELNLTGSFDLGIWHPLHVILNGDYVENLGYDDQEVNERVGYKRGKQNTGYQVGLTVGHADTNEYGLWKVSGAYRYLERDAVMDAFTDSDFNLGGTNAKGWILSGDFGLAKNVWLSTKWLTANEIDQDHVNYVSRPGPLSIDVFQFNLNAKF